MVDLKHRPAFVYFLAAISILGTVFQLLSIGLNWDLGRWPLVATLLIIGAALLVESQIRIIFKGGYTGKDVFGHLATGMMGGIALVTGIILIPFWGLALTGTLLAFTIIVLIFHILAVIAEVFLI